MTPRFRRDAAAPPPTLIVALHGYGGSGDEMRRWLDDAQGSFGSLAERNVTVWAPMGSEAAPLATQGRAWFPLTARADSRRALARPPALRMVEELKIRQQELGIGAERTRIIGFSQGCNVAVPLLARPRGAARAVLIAGRFEPPPHESIDNVSLLGIVGERDRFVDPEKMSADLEALGSASHEMRVVPGLAHELSRQVAVMALAFCLGEDPSRDVPEIRPVDVVAPAASDSG